MEKRILRQRLKTVLLGLTQDYIKEISIALHERLFSMQVYQSAKSVAVFYAMKGEIETQSIIDHALSMDKRVYLPRIVGDEMRLLPYEKEKLEWNKFGFFEPPLGTDAGNLDLLIVPGLAFTLEGKRLGRGKGYYDRYISSHSCYTIALAFPQQILPTIPTDQHDQIIDIVLTPNT